MTAAVVAAAALALVLPAHADAVESGEPTPLASAPGLSERPSGPKKNAKGEPRTITLITGDRVTMVGDEQSSVAAGPGRHGMTFLTSTNRGHTSVISMDAAYLVRAGRVDPRLFDVTALLAQGLDRKPTLPLIVTATSSAKLSTTRRAVDSEGASAGRKLTAVNGIAVQAEPARTTELWNGLTGKSTAGEATPTTLRAGVAKIWLDGVLHVSLDKSVPQIGAPTAWKGGYDGIGVTVAVLDSGIDAAHPDLAGQVSEVRDFTGLGSGDSMGHGTHVASIIAGTGKASDGRFKGVAPGAKIADGKVCGVEECSESALLAGMQWAAADIKAPIVNMSLSGMDTAQIDPVEAAVNSLSGEYGTLFVISAGNEGPDESTVGSPGSADAALTVGAVDDTDELAEFSSRGPRVGDGAIKPDITAPGVDITAARASTNIIDDGASGPYLTISGTSMAAPHVAGAGAILAQHRPGTPGGQLKELLTSSAKPHPGIGVDAQGSGRVDIARALAQTVTAPGSLNLGTQVWPHTDDEALTKEVTYRNSGATALTLALAASVTAPDGTAGPDDALKLSAASMTVPAGGTATVEASMLLPATAALGRWSGQIVATAPGDVQVRTPFTMVQEVEMVELTIKQLDERGEPVADTNGYATVYGYDGVISNELVRPGAGPLRVPVGSYFVNAWQQAAPDRASRLSLMSAPEIVLDKPTTITFDARQARKVDVKIPERHAAQEFITVTASAYAPKMYESVTIIAGSEPVWLGSLGPAATSGIFRGKIIGHWAKPDAQGQFGDSPYGYHGAWYQEGTFFTGFSKTLSKTGGATVTSTMGRNKIDKATMLSFPQWPEAVGFGPTWVDNEHVNLPTRRTERFFVNTAEGQWDRELWESADDSPAPSGVALRAETKLYRAGQHYRESWNVPVYGPVVTPDPPGQFELGFYRDGILVAPSMVADASGHFGWQYIYDDIRTKITCDGRVIADMNDRQGFGDVPPEVANYRVEQRLDRHSFAALSTHSEAVWTFRAAAPHDKGWVPLPLSAIQFRPDVNSTGHQKGGGVLRIPVTMQRLGAAGKAKQITVQVSYDDGDTWSTPEKLTPKDGVNVVAKFTGTNARNGYVSLRATSLDTKGSTVTQTLIRAFTRG